MAAFDDDCESVEGVFGDVFGTEDVTYKPPFPGSERIVTVSLQQVHEASMDQVGDETIVEQLFVRCKRDAINGIDAPQVGDLIVRNVAHDPGCRPYAYTGRKEVVTQSRWVLVYQRNFHSARGPRG